MNSYSADLHIHSVLSPCGDLDMSPGRIIDVAAEQGLDIIAITDHNHTGHAKLTRDLGKRKGIWVVYGAEITSREDVHCLTFFDTDSQLEEFQAYIEDQMPIIANDSSLFGDQVIVDENELILEEISRSLYPGLNVGVTLLAEEVIRLGGLFVPAHVDRRMNGLYAQLGFFPEGMKADAVEIYRTTSREEIRKEHPELKAYKLIKSSDAHYTEDIGRCTSKLLMKTRNFEELRLALHGEKGRNVLEV